MNRPAMLADHLDAETDAIIAVWRSGVARVGKREIAKDPSSEDLVDHVPALLDRLAERLRGLPGDATAEGHELGQITWSQGYNVAEVVEELGELRAALIRATFEYARKQKFDLLTLEAVWEVICEVMNEAISEAVTHFQELNAAKPRAALDWLDAGQLDLEDASRADVSERAKLRAILGHLPVAVWVARADGTIVGVNREAERLQGLPAEHTVERCNVFQPPEERMRFSRLDGSAFELDEMPLVRALRGETVDQAEMVWQIAGETRVVSVNAAPLTDEAGAVTGGIAVAQDVTTRKRTEDELNDRLSFATAISDAMGEGLLTVDCTARITFVNPGAEQMFGWTAAELLGKNIHEAIHGQHPDGSTHPTDECPLIAVIRAGASLRDDDVFVRRDRTTFPVAFTISPISTAGALSGAVLTFHDISVRKRLEASLAESEARFRIIAEHSPVMIWRAGSAGQCDYVNQTYLDFRGRSLAQVIGQGWVEGVHPEDRVGYLEKFRVAFKRQEPFEHTFRLLRHDGQYRWVTSRGTPYFDDRGTFLGYLGSCIDITPRIELEEVLEQQRELAEESSIHKTRLLSALSHDARTPLNAVVLASELLEMHCRAMNNPEVDECLRTIRNSVGSLLELLGDLLNLTRIEAGVVPAEPTRFALEPVLAESLSSIETQARVKGLDVVLEPGALAGVVVETDRSKLKRILGNLLSNALRYTERGRIRIAGSRTVDNVEIAVEDTGIGIAQADQQRIFEEFETLSSPRRLAGEGGTGLGLAICRRLANLLSGEIVLRSTPGQGSTFVLVLPASIISPGPVEEEAHPGGKIEPPGSGLIVIAEDHLISRLTMAKVLRRMGYRVLEASNGVDVLSLVERERPLAVLMDVNMPLMDGIDATLAIRADARFRDLPIFALTGDVTAENQRRIDEAGVNGYLEKPVKWDALKQALASLKK